MVYLHEITILHGLRKQTLNLVVGGNDLTFGSGRVIGQLAKLLNFLHRAVAQRLLYSFFLGVFSSLGFLLLTELLVLLLDELLIGSVGLVGQQQTLTQFLALGLRITLEGMEVFLVILEDHLVQNGFLYLAVLAVALVDKEDKALDEVLLLVEVLLILLARHFEGVHADGMLLGVGDIDTALDLTEHLIAVADIDDDNIGVLLEELAHDSVHEEALTASAGAKNKVITIVGHLLRAFLAGEVDGHGNTLAVGIPELQRGLLTVLLAFLIHQAEGCVAERQEPVVVGIESATVAGERGHEQLQLIVGTLGNLDVHATEEVLQIVVGLRHAGIAGEADGQAEMGIDELLVLTGDDVLYLLDVLDGEGIAGGGNRAVAVLLFVEHGQLMLLVGHEDDLVIDG